MIGIHPNIFKFVDGLLREQAETDLVISQIEAGRDPPSKRPKYAAHEKRLFKIVKKFNDDLPYFDGKYLPYLKSIAHNTRL